MTDTYHVTDIRTGENFDGARAAVITAPQNAAPGSLEPLTSFFQEHGYEAQLGYSGEYGEHVLRIHGFSSDSALRTLLLRDYPQWEQKQNIGDSAHSALIRFPNGDLPFQPMDASPEKQAGSFMQAIQGRSTDLSAAAYMAGNIGLVFSALYGNKQGGRKELLKLGAPLCYTMASAFLLLLNRQAPKPRSMEEIWNTLSPQLLRGDYTASPQEAAKNRKAGEQAVGHVWNFMKSHPWEVSGLLNMLGAGSHMSSALRRGQHTEAVAALSTLTAMAITTFMQEKGKHAAFAEKAFAPVGGATTVGSVHLLEGNHGIFQPFFDTGSKILDWIQEKPLRTASVIQLAANTGYGIAAVNKKNDQGNRAVDWGLLATSGTFMAGNGFQAIATKTKGPSYDDIITKAARAISRQTDWQGLPREQLHPRLLHVANLLTQQPEISQSEDQLAAGIIARLAREDPAPDMAENTLEGFIPTEKDMLKGSPFISPHKLESALSSPRQIG